MKDFIFYNVTIPVSANSAKEAYTKLCEMLKDAGEYTTDTYTIVSDLEETDPKSTSELFPD